MPPAGELKAVSLALSVVVTGIAGLLSLRQWREWRLRDPDLSIVDERYYRRQLYRRGVGAIVMVLLAIGLSVGSRLPHMIAKHTNPWFLAVWLAVFVLVLILLGLAFFDLMATREYARRLKRALARERLEILRAEARRKASRSHGRNGPRLPENGFLH